MRVTKVWSGLISLNNYELVIGTDAASPSSHLLLTSSSQKELHRTPFKSNLHNSSGRDTAEKMEWIQRGGVTCPRSTSSSKTEPKFKFLTPQSIMVSLLLPDMPKMRPSTHQLTSTPVPLSGHRCGK